MQHDAAYGQNETPSAESLPPSLIGDGDAANRELAVPQCRPGDIERAQEQRDVISPIPTPMWARYIESRLRQFAVR